jgi:Ca-activated chloride channel family protein
MGFLTPLALAFAALSVPILVLYMLKLRRRDVLVSSTLLWQRLLRDREANAPWQRLRRNLLMLLQLLTLALMTVALARPYLPTPSIVSGSVVILLDASASMQAADVAPTRFEAARRAAREVLNGLGSDDVATIIAVGPQPKVLAAATGDRAALRGALDRAVATDGPADWEAAAALAAASLAGTEDTHTVILSDGALPEALPPLPGEVHFVRVGTSGDNLAVVALAVREGMAGPQALLRVTNSGQSAAETSVEFRADGVLFDVRRLAIGPNDSATLVLDDLPYDLTLLEARLLAEDPLPLDDVAWAVRSLASQRRVLLVTPGNLFLERALGILPGLEVTRLPSGQPLPSEPSDLVVYDGVVTGTLPAGNTWVIGGYGTAPGVFTDTAVVRVAEDPILRYVDLEDVQIRQAWAVDPPPGARVLVEAEGGPLLFVAERPEGRLAVLTFDLHDSDLPLRVAFPILTANLTGWLLPQSGVGPGASVQPGDVVPIQPAPEAEEILVTAPDGEGHALPIGETLPVFAATDRVGVYQVAQFDSDGALLRLEPLAVNLFDPAESDIASRDTVWVGRAEVSVATAEGEGRREFWPWLAGAALAVLGAEWWAYQVGTGRHTAKVRGRD